MRHGDVHGQGEIALQEPRWAPTCLFYICTKKWEGLHIPVARVPCSVGTASLYRLNLFLIMHFGRIFWAADRGRLRVLLCEYRCRDRVISTTSLEATKGKVEVSQSQFVLLK